jgi:hypothetical protein
MSVTWWVTVCKPIGAGMINAGSQMHRAPRDAALRAAFCSAHPRASFGLALAGWLSLSDCTSTAVSLGSRPTRV